MIRKSTINRTALLLLPLFGISSGSLYTLIIRVFWVVSIMFIKLCHYRYVVKHLNPENFFDLVDCLCSFLAHTKVITKLVAFWINQKKLIETMTLVVNDWSDCAGSDIGVRLTARKAKISDRITNIIIALHSLSIFAYCFGVIIADADVTDGRTELPFVNKLDLPFSINTRNMYRFILIAESIHMLFCNWVSGVVNAMLLTLTLHAGGQMELLQHWLAQLLPDEIGNKQEMIATSTIVLKHQKIIQFSENIECLYTYIALFQFISNAIMICSLAFLIVSAIGTPDATQQIIRCLLFYTITNLEAFIYCFAGEYLKNKSKAIGVAAYNSTWYNLKPEHSRTLIFVILRSQKQLALTVGKMTELSLEYFASIMNASGSYLSVMLAMQ